MSFDAFAATPNTPAEPSTPTESASQSTQDTTPTAQPTAQSTPDPIAAKSAQQSQIQATNNKTEPSPYSPNFKFKSLDNEYEFDPVFHPIVKEEIVEKRLRELYEKAYGLDSIKPKYQSLQSKYQQAEQFIGNIVPQINEMREAYQRGDFDTYFKLQNVPEEKILQWVIGKAQYMELPPEQRKVLDEKRAAETKALQLERQVGTYQQQLEEQVTQAKAYSLQVALERPDYKSIAQAFDARAGRPGAFRDAIIDAGELAWIRSNGKVDLTPEQAIQQVIAYWGNPAKPAEAPIIPAQQQPMMTHQQSQPQRTATIPNVAGRQSTSVAKSKPKSIEDLKKLAAQMSG